MKEHDLVIPTGFDPEVAVLLGSLADSKHEWLENLGRPSAEAMVWQHHENGPSIGALILHMADCELYWFEQFLAGQPADQALEHRLLTLQVQQDSGVWPTPPKKPLRWYLDLHDEVAQRSRKWLEGMPADRMVASRKRSFSVRWVVSHVVQHDAYHGGQAVMLHEMWKRQKGS